MSAARLIDYLIKVKRADTGEQLHRSHGKTAELALIVPPIIRQLFGENAVLSRANMIMKPGKVTIKSLVWETTNTHRKRPTLQEIIIIIKHNKDTENEQQQNLCLPAG
jgi:hypothetical protein